MSPTPTTPPSMWVTRTSMPSITALPTITNAPSVTSSPTTNSSNLGRLGKNHVAGNSSTLTSTPQPPPAAKPSTLSSSVAPSSRPSKLLTMPHTPSSSPIYSQAPYHQASPALAAATPIVSMIPTASSSPTTSRYPSIAPSSLAQQGKPDHAKTNANSNSSNQNGTAATFSATASARTTSAPTTTLGNNTTAMTTTNGFSQSCPGFSSGGTGQVEKEVIFTYMVQTTLTQPINSTSLLTDLEQQLLVHAANATLSCQDLSPFHIYQLAYPTPTTTTTSSNSFTNIATCQPTTTKTSSSAKSCWILQTHMLVTTDEDTTDRAKYTVLAALQQELDKNTAKDTSSLLATLPQLVSTHYLGPDPQSTAATVSGTNTPATTILSTPNATSQPHNHVLLPISILLLVLAVISSAFLIGFLVWIRQRRRKRLLEDPDSSSFLFSFKSASNSRNLAKQLQQPKSSPSPSNTMDTDLEMEMAEISDLLSRSKQRLQQHPPPRASFDSQDVSKTSSSTTSGTSNILKPTMRTATRGNSVKFQDSESLTSYGPTEGHRGLSPNSKDSSSSSRRQSQRKTITTEVVEDNSRRRAERILEASASFHSRLSWTSSLDSESVLMRTTQSDETTVQETLAMARSATSRSNEQILFYEDEDDASSASPREEDTRYGASSNNTRDGLLRDSNHRKSSSSSSTRRAIGYDVKLPDLGRPTRGTRDVYHRSQQHSLL